MARVATSNIALGTWLDGENPGAGSQSVDSTGLNGNAIKIDTAIGAEHNADGTHKAAKIDKGNLKTTVADGSTLELHATNGLQAKDAGITAAKLASNAVETAKIKDANVTAAKLAASAIAIGGTAIQAGALKAADFGASAVETAAIKNANVTTEKLEYKELVGYLNQAGTGNPTLQIIKNTLGEDPAPARYAVGVYYLNTTGAIYTSKAKTFIIIMGNAYDNATTFGQWVSTTNVTVNTHSIGASPAAADSLLRDTMIMIRVYP